MGRSVRYRGTEHFGWPYHAAALGCLLVLAAALGVFLATGLHVGALAVAPAIAFVVWAYLGCRKVEVVVSDEELLGRYWFIRLRVRLSDVASVELSDRMVLPPHQQGHLRLGPGYHRLEGYQVLSCGRGAPVVQIRRKDGALVLIVWPEAEELRDALAGGAHAVAPR